MTRKPIETLLQLYGAPYPFWAAARKAIRLVREYGGVGLLEAVKQKLTRPSLPVDVLRADSGKRLTYEERWVIRGHGLSCRYSVSVIILTKGNQESINVCLTSLARSALPDARLEILVVNNGQPITVPSTYPFPVRLLRETRRFNWAAYNNSAAERTSSEFLLFLNDDVEALHGGWLDAMLAEAVRPQAGAGGATLPAEAIKPETGAVAPKLLYPNGTIQNCGIIVTPDGYCEHVYKFRPREYPGERGECLRPREVMAVTGACLLSRKDTFQRLGGFDERFPLNYSDVDFCLCLNKSGRRVIVTPYAELVHRETTTRSFRTQPREKWLFQVKQDRWCVPGPQPPCAG